MRSFSLGNVPLQRSSVGWLVELPFGINSTVRVGADVGLVHDQAAEHAAVRVGGRGSRSTVWSAAATRRRDGIEIGGEVAGGARRCHCSIASSS